MRKIKHIKYNNIPIIVFNMFQESPNAFLKKCF